MPRSAPRDCVKGGVMRPLYLTLASLGLLLGCGPGDQPSTASSGSTAGTGGAGGGGGGAAGSSAGGASGSAGTSAGGTGGSGGAMACGDPEAYMPAWAVNAKPDKEV